MSDARLAAVPAMTRDMAHRPAQAHRPEPEPLHPAVAALFAVALLLGLFAVTALFFAGALS